MGSASATATESKVLVMRWVNAFNARDLDGMLSCVHPDVDFRPLKLTGLDHAYRGHDGVRSWFAELDDLRYAHRIDLSAVREASGGRLLAIGDLSVGGQDALVPFCALHQVGEGLIVAGHHYLCDPDRVVRLGLVS